MFAVIYRFKLKPHQEEVYKSCWETLANYFIEKRGAIGSCLHKGLDGLWVAYSRWPSRAMRDASWPGDNQPSDEIPEFICHVIQKMQKIKKENEDLEQYDEICLDVISDKLLSK